MVVVGSSRGIGLEIANDLVRHNNVFAYSRSSRPPEMSQDVKYFPLDVADQDSINTNLVNSSPNLIDGIVYVAGFSTPSDGQEVARFVKTIDINLIGAFRVIEALQDKLAPNSSVVFVSSINANLAFPNNPGYVASKAGLEGLVRALSLDLASIPCRVNAISLGYFVTDMTRSSFNDPEKKKQREARTVLGRWGELREITPAVEFLLSDKSSYMTGQALVIDGGWTVRGI